MRTFPETIELSWTERPKRCSERLASPGRSRGVIPEEEHSAGKWRGNIHREARTIVSRLCFTLLRLFGTSLMFRE